MDLYTLEGDGVSLRRETFPQEICTVSRTNHGGHTGYKNKISLLHRAHRRGPFMLWTGDLARAAFALSRPAAFLRGRKMKKKFMALLCAVLTVFALAFAVGCGGSESNAEASFAFSQTSYTVEEAKNIVLSFKTENIDGFDESEVTVTSSLPSVASVSGLTVTGVSAGEAELTATYGELTATVKITVTAQAVGDDTDWQPDIWE